MQSVNWLSVRSPNNVACAKDLTGHLNAPGESVRAIVSREMLIKGRGHSYCKPIRLKVSRAIRMDSVDPFMDGVPAHDAA